MQNIPCKFTLFGEIISQIVYYVDITISNIVAYTITKKYDTVKMCVTHIMQPQNRLKVLEIYFLSISIELYHKNNMLGLQNGPLISICDYHNDLACSTG